MTDYSDFTASIADYANRQDWSPALLMSFVRDAEQKLNSELRVDRMLEFQDVLVMARSAPLPADWLQMDLIRIANPNAADGFSAIRYVNRDKFFSMQDVDAVGSYTIQGRQIWIGGAPNATDGQMLKLTYYGEVPVFSDTTPSWVYTKHPSLYRYAALMHADLHAVGEEQTAAQMKQLTEDMINKLNVDHTLSRNSGSRLIRSRRSFG